jgi:hypothetical protein
LPLFLYMFFSFQTIVRGYECHMGLSTNRCPSHSSSISKHCHAVIG